ncbi:hypothetical protein IAD21_02896 [Abditibacteriota bacterium]|nr:hypothetical protein IAD21_02896 [Abditibacteriota bacterium]
MKFRYLSLGFLAIAFLGGIYGVSRMFTGGQEFERPTPAVPTPTPYGMIAMPMTPPVMTPIQVKPSRRIESPVHSPNGRFIAFQLAKVRAQDSTYMACVLDANTGKVLGCGEEGHQPEKLTWQEPTRLAAGPFSYSLVANGKSWKFERGRGGPEFSLMGRPPATFGGRQVLNISAEETLPHADLALWFLQNPNSGQGQLGASSLSTTQEVPLPLPLRSTRGSHRTKYAAPSLRKGSPRLLAQMFPISDLSSNMRLEVWNLSLQRRLFGRLYPESSFARLHWTRDGRFLMAMNVGRRTPVADPNGITYYNNRKVKNKDLPPTYEQNGIDILDARTGEIRTALSIPSDVNPVPPSVSSDGRFLLTREPKGAQVGVAKRLAIREIPSGRIVCVFERDREIVARPSFAEHDSGVLVWTFEDTIFLQRWQPSKSPQKLAPSRFKIALNSPIFG